MGNTFASRANETQESIIAIEKQRANLVDKQAGYLTEATRVKRVAAQHMATKNRTLALACMRRYRAILKQADGLSGMIATLDSHQHALEAKAFTSETMKVMKTTAQALSRNQMSVDSVDDYMIQQEEQRDFVMGVTNAMGLTEPVDDEELMAMLADEGVVVVPEQADAAPATAVLSGDAKFIEDIEREVAEFMLPAVPKHAIGRPPSPPPPVYEQAKPDLSSMLAM